MLKKFIKLLIIKIISRRQNIKIGNSRISLESVKRLNNVEIGDYCVISPSASIECGVYIGHRCDITSCIIQEYASIGNNVSIGPGDHFSEELVFSKNLNPKIVLEKKQTIIGRDCWVGTGAVILQGVRVGDKSVVGANSVVTSDVPERVIVAGVPAKVIRKLDENT